MDSVCLDISLYRLHYVVMALHNNCQPIQTKMERFATMLLNRIYFVPMNIMGHIWRVSPNNEPSEIWSVWRSTCRVKPAKHFSISHNYFHLQITCISIAFNRSTNILTLEWMWMWHNSSCLKIYPRSYTLGTHWYRCASYVNRKYCPKTHDQRPIGKIHITIYFFFTLPLFHSISSPILPLSLPCSARRLFFTFQIQK